MLPLKVTSVSDDTKKSGQRLVGDVEHDGVSAVAGWLTPVPGGVGPMTVAMLLKNTVEGAKRALQNQVGFVTLQLVSL